MTTIEAFANPLDQYNPGQSRIGLLLERTVRLMETQEQEYIDAYIKIGDTTPFYVSQETTRAIVADAWSKLEENLSEANVALNATDDEPHERILSLLGAAQEVVRYAGAIYTLTPLPDEDDS